MYSHRSEFGAKKTNNYGKKNNDFFDQILQTPHLADKGRQLLQVYSYLLTVCS